MLKIINFRVGSIASNTILVNNGGSLSLPYVQNRTMTSKRVRALKPKPAPFPYRDRTYNEFWSFFDQTYKRFDVNSKIIILEGPVASGKHALAKSIAEQFNMKYVPDITMDYEYINHYGYDLRNLDYKLPESLQSFDENDFCQNPTHLNAAAFQLQKYRLRWIHHWNIINHLLNTGEGIVTVRSPFSTGAFTNAMRQCNYMSEAAKFTYNEVVRHTIAQLFRPHLILYLDVSVDQTLENIKNRNRDAEANGKALNRKFLQCIEDEYKNFYLREASIHSLILHYDWTEGGDEEIVIEDIERLEFEKYLDEECEDLKMNDWRMEEDRMNWERIRYSRDFDEHQNQFSNILIYDAPELHAAGEDWLIYDQVMATAPGHKYAAGYNVDRGDNNVLFKNKFIKNYRDIPE